MYHELFVNICGMFNVFHYCTIALFFGLLVLCLYLSKNLSVARTQLLSAWVAILVVISEIIKIAVRIHRGLWPDSWMPLYYCSLFIFAICGIHIPCNPIRRAGYSFITMGGILASICFTLYPSTSLGMYPLLSMPVLHSFFYHLSMCYCGILFLWKGLYKPVKKDAIAYFLFAAVACVIAIPLNEWLGTNCMFLRHPFNMPVLQPILEFSKPLYMLIVGLAQSCGMFWINYGGYTLYKRIRKKV